MPIFMGIGAALAFAFATLSAYFALAADKVSIEIYGVAALAFFAGLILWGFAGLFQKMKDEAR